MSHAITQHTTCALSTHNMQAVQFATGTGGAPRKQVPVYWCLPVSTLAVIAVLLRFGSFGIDRSVFGERETGWRLLCR